MMRKYRDTFYAETGSPKCHIMLDSSEINEKLMKEGSLLPTDSS